MQQVAITGTGLYTPSQAISNEELVAAFNQYVDLYNEENANAIAEGMLAPLAHSSPEFIAKASGIRSRYVIDKSGILDPTRLVPHIPERSNDEPSLQCEMAVIAARQAMSAANCGPGDIDAVIVACSNLQRPYPAIAIEVQAALNIEGFAFDMNVACSSATFGIAQASGVIRDGLAKRVLMVNPEICSGHLNFTDRDSHFIFGDVCTAVIVEDASLSTGGFLVRDIKLKTMFSNNIRNNFGFLNRADENGIGQPDKLFIQEGRKVFKEVCPAVAALISEQLDLLGTPASELRRMWLHQANLNMNDLIARKVLGRQPTVDEAPVILDEYANTSSAGSVIAFHKHQSNLQSGDLGILCSFGAGYSIGSVVLQKR
ncbi:beta-ketoacyl-ACP synthase III [Aequoribacter sp.]|uniref:beta-ketoacyl-ACP synthase III n=1 Tax=Aequoribacter sp. TaxID=2847771 RepID=UPI003F6A0563